MDSAKDSRSTHAPDPGTKTLHFVYSFQCNLQCEHCIYRCGPENAPTMDLHRAASYVEQAHEAGIRQIVFNGGEPLLHDSAIRVLIRRAIKHEIRVSLVSNGFWGSTEERARETLSTLKQAGLESLTLSTDRFHLARVSWKHLVHILHASRELRIKTGVKIARLPQDPVADGLYRSLRSYTDRIQIQGISPLGRASHLRKAVPLKRLHSLRRPGCSTPPVLLPSGHLLTCCNLPAREVDLKNSPLVLGHLGDKTLTGLLDERASSPLLNLLRERGPVSFLTQFEGAAFRNSRVSIPTMAHDGCDLCFHLFRTDPLGAVTHAFVHPSYQTESPHEA